ncbi:hypothetical protein [Halobacteriovorax sp.]|uniref:hypothetical protein n=1 Tax=Halobacteriovorax sp. TaxID=2020862 RepID=UPI00356A8EC3
MKFLIILLFLSNSFAQENFGMKEKVNSFAEKEVRKILTNEFISRLDKYKKLEKKPKEYYNSLGFTEEERKAFFKFFPDALKEDLPSITLNKAGLITLTYKGESAHFSFSDLAKSQVYIKNKLVKLPVGNVKNFTEYFNIFNENMYKSFNEKSVFFKALELIIPNASAQTISGEEYLSIPDGKSVPEYNREGWDRNDKVENLYKEEQEHSMRMYGFKVNHNIRQTKQVLLAAVMAISSDIYLDFMANYKNKRTAIPNNLKTLFTKIGKMAATCDEERRETGGKFVKGSEATKMLTALEVVNEKMNRIESVGKNWWGEIDDLVWQRTTFHFNPDYKSYNICKVKRITEMYEDKKLCDNLEKLTQCLVDFRTSGKVSNTRLNDEQMDLLIDNPRGRDYGQDDILNWVQEK